MNHGFRRWTRGATAVLLIGALGGATQAVGQSVQPRLETLDNGLKLILVERHEQPTVAAGVFYNVGSVNDPAGRSGIAHLFEHMLFKGTHVLGTTDYAADAALIAQQDQLRVKLNAEMDRMRDLKRLGQISDVLDSEQWTPEYRALKEEEDKLIEAERQLVKNNEVANLYTANGGAMLNAGTAEDMTMYFVQLPANKLELFFWVESDRMANAVMREFYTERDNVREERRLSTESTPTGKFDEAFEALFWQSHPYGIPVLGWASDVESVTRDDVREFYRKYYVPNNATLVMIGDFAADEAIALAKRYFGRVARGATPPKVITEEPQAIAERRFNAEMESNPIVTVRYLTVAMGHQDEAALNVVSELLSGKTGRLYKRLVTEADAVIGQPRANSMSRKYAGYLEITATVKEGHTLEDAEKLVLEEIEKLRTGDIPDRELQKVKNQILADSIRALQNNVGLMFQLGIFETWYKWSYINESPQLMLAVTADDVHRVVQQYLDPKLRTVAFYRTKAGAAPAAGGELDTLLAGLPAEARPQIKALVDRIKVAGNADELRQRRQMMEQMSGAEGMAPEEKAVLDYLLKVIDARVAELDSADKEVK